MNVKEFLNREIEAIKRDRQYDKEHSGVVGHTLQEALEHMEQYPSIMTRLHRIHGSLCRGKSNVVEFPYTVKNFIHRGRYGWATPDTWSMDYTLAKQLEGVFRDFVRVSSDLIDYEQDNTASIALEIADGFQAWHEYQDKEWSGTVEDYKKDFEEASAKVKRSCELMGENWYRFWW